MFGRLRRWWTSHWRDAIFDGAPPLILLALGLVNIATGSLSEAVTDAPPITSLIPGTIACLALFLRRYRPLLTLVIVLAALFLPPLVQSVSITFWDEFIVWVVALYSCARHSARPRSYVGLGTSVVAFIVLQLEFPELRDTGGVLFYVALLAAAFTGGLVARSWAQSRVRLIREAAERAVAEERASRRERVRIARELHDVIAHTITVIVMQAGGARLASATDPALAVSTLAQIEDLGRSSLAELRTLLPLLRDDDEQPSAPAPTLAQVEPLVERMRSLGLPVSLSFVDDVSDLAPGLQLTAYRTVQEGLTNVVKHAGMVATDVRIHRDGSRRAVLIDVQNQVPVGTAVAGAASHGLGGSGRGLVGLQERVRLSGGVFEAATSQSAGFTLHVELPVTGDRA